MPKNFVKFFLFLLVFVTFSYSVMVDFGRFGQQRRVSLPSKKDQKSEKVYINSILSEDEIEKAKEDLTRQMKSLSMKDINPNKVGFDSMELDLSSVAYPVVLLSDGIETGGFTISVEICRAFNNLLLAHKRCVVVPTDNEYVSASFLRQGLHSPSYTKVGLDADYIVTKASVLALGQKGRSLLKDTRYLDLLLKLGSEPMFFMVKKGSDINTFFKMREYLLDNVDTKQRIFVGNKKYAFDIVAFFAGLQLPIENLQFAISDDKDAVISDFCARANKEDILIEYFHTDSTRKIEASGCVSQLEIIYFTRQELAEVMATPFASVADVSGKIPKVLQNTYYKSRDGNIAYMKEDGDLSEEEAAKKYPGVYVPTTDIVLAASRNANGKEVFQMIMSYLYSFTSIRKNENIGLMVHDIKRGRDLLSPYVGTGMIYHPVVANYALFNDLFLGNKSLRRMEKEFMNYSLRSLIGKSSGIFLPAMPTTEQMLLITKGSGNNGNTPPPANNNANQAPARGNANTPTTTTPNSNTPPPANNNASQAPAGGNAPATTTPNSNTPPPANNNASQTPAGGNANTPTTPAPNSNTPPPANNNASQAPAGGNANAPTTPAPNSNTPPPAS